jgi:hypothetical protein
MEDRDGFIFLLRTIERLTDVHGHGPHVRDEVYRSARKAGFSEDMIFLAWVGSKTARAK